MSAGQTGTKNGSSYMEFRNVWTLLVCYGDQAISVVVTCYSGHVSLNFHILAKVKVQVQADRGSGQFSVQRPRLVSHRTMFET